LPAIAVPVGTSDSEYVVVVVGALEPRAALPVADLEAELGTELLCAEAKGERARSATREDKKESHRGSIAIYKNTTW
jgi:hypothetical protein